MSAVLVTHLRNCPEFLAGDHTLLRELLHPDRAAVSARYSLAHARLEPGVRSKRHRLATSEVYYFLQGQGRFTIGEQTVEIEVGAVVYVPPGGVQTVENTGRDGLEFLCIVDPAWKAGDEEVLE